MMKTELSLIALAAALVLPGLAEARPITVTTELDNYGGRGAYLAVYVTDAAGAYQGTLYVAGRKSQYFRHLSDWARAGGSAADGATGASVGSGRTLTISVDLADALFDAGYEIHVDVAVEDMRDSPSDAVVPLTSAGAGQPVAGRSYVQSLRYDM
jgi:hypothetical protein